MVQAAVRMPMLSRAATQLLRLPPLRAHSAGDLGDWSDGPRLLYTFARIETLFERFEQLVRDGVYEPFRVEQACIDDLAPHLTGRSEWRLVWWYLAKQPGLAIGAVGMPTDAAARISVDTQRVAVSLAVLCRAFSSFYRTTRVLLEPEATLVPRMRARLLLCHAVRQCLWRDMTLLGVEPIRGRI